MKYPPLLLSALLLLSAGNSLAQSAAIDHKALAKRSLALRAAAQETLQLLSAQPSDSDQDGLQQALASELLTGVEQHQSHTASVQTSQIWITRWRVQDFDNKAKAVWVRASEQSPLPIKAEDILKRAASDWQEQRDQGASRFAEVAIEQVYPAARKRAIEQQRSALQDGLKYPSQDELDPQLLPLDKKRNRSATVLQQRDFRQLMKFLAPYASHGGVVFEELKPDVARLTERMCDEVGSQYLRQTESVRSGIPEEKRSVLTASGMEAHLLNVLSAGFPGTSPATPPDYAAFAIVRQWIPDLAADWERKRLQRHLAKAPGWAPSATDIKARVTADLPAHQNPKESAKRIQREIVDSQTPAVAQGMAAAADSGEREALRTYFDNALRDPKHLGGVWEQAISGHIGKHLPGIRRTLAQEQFAAHFPSLHENPDLAESVVLWFHDRKLNEAKDIQQVISGINGNGEHPFPEALIPTLLDETKTQAINALNVPLKPALDSLGKQLLIVKQMEKEKLEQLKEDVAAGVPRSELSTQWTAEWEERWSGVSAEVAEPWTGMFVRSRNELDKTVRQLFESTANPIPAATPVAVQTPSEKNAETEQPNSSEMTAVEVPAVDAEKEEGAENGQELPGAGQGEGEPKETGMTKELASYSGRADGVLSFSDLSNGACRLLFGSPDGTGALSVEFDPEQVERSARKIADALRTPLREVLNGSSTKDSRGVFKLLNRSKTPQLNMLFRVDSPAIRHQMSIRVRQHIKQEIQDWAAETGKTPPELLWKDESGSP